MKQVNWQAKNDYEYVQNFKIVQKVMTQNKITKPVPIDRLVKAKYQVCYCYCCWQVCFCSVLSSFCYTRKSS